jgi:enamine deaminase RidA (YjgF/YER057c/UK114 family)
MVSVRPAVSLISRAVLGSGPVTIEDRLQELGIELTEVFPPAGKYVGAVRTGSLVFVSGAGPIRPDGTFVTGKVGRAVDLDEEKEAARLTGVQLLSVLRGELGSLDRVARIVKTLGMVNCAPGFNRTPAVIDGCSELLIKVFGEAGRGARSAVGMAELPFDIAVEIELVAEVTD